MLIISCPVQFTKAPFCRGVSGVVESPCSSIPHHIAQAHQQALGMPDMPRSSTQWLPEVPGFKISGHLSHPTILPFLDILLQPYPRP